MIFSSVVIAAATLFVAYANGANDNFKGVATLFGSGITSYRKALCWATLTTFAGSIAALFLATELIAVFRGSGLVPAFLLQSRTFVVSVSLGAALTVLIATKIAMPISTTHSLTGALVGSGLVAAGFQLGWQTLLGSFFLPLLVSPFLAVLMAMIGDPLLQQATRRTGLTRENCLCVASRPATVAATMQGLAVYQSAPGMGVIVDSQRVCAEPQMGALFGVGGAKILDVGHLISAGAVCFARGLNDTPKIVALGLLASTVDLSWIIGLVAVVMAVGGWLNARKVAETVSYRITPMDPEQALVANLVTSGLVLWASKWGVPVSTTHVSCGALFGIGVANGQGRWQVIRTILLAWLLTLPCAAILASGIYLFLSWLAVA